MASAARGAVRNVVRKCEVMVAVSNRNIIRRSFSDIPGDNLVAPRKQLPAAPQNLPPAALQVLAHFEDCDSFHALSKTKACSHHVRMCVKSKACTRIMCVYV